MGLRYIQAGRPDGDITVDTILTANITAGLLAAENEPFLTPVCKIMKAMFGAVRETASVRKEVMDLVEHCVGISKCVVDSARVGTMPPSIQEKLGKFKAEVEAVVGFTGTTGQQKSGSCCKLTYSTRNGDIPAKHKQWLRKFLDHMLRQGIAGERTHHGPPGGRLAEVPFGAPPLPDTYVRRVEDKMVVSELIDPQRPASKLHYLWGKGGVGKSLMASSVVRDQRTLRRFAQGVFWINVGGVEEATELPLEQLALQFANSRAGRGHAYGGGLKAAEHITRYLRLARGNRRCLVVLNNAQRDEVVEAFADTGFHLLITTRERREAPPRCSGEYTKVPEMAMGDALKVLQRASDPIEALNKAEAKKVSLLEWGNLGRAL